jgi:hypothetical protein
LDPLDILRFPSTPRRLASPTWLAAREYLFVCRPQDGTFHPPLQLRSLILADGGAMV